MTIQILKTADFLIELHDRMQREILGLYNRRRLTSDSVDYLQIYRIQGDGMRVTIEHEQEEPYLSDTIVLDNFGCLCDLEVFSVEEGDRVTFMLSDEY